MLAARHDDDIYIYILSSTDRLFRCITTHQCGYTRKMLQTRIKTRLTLRLSDILQRSYRKSQRNRTNYTYIYFLLFTYTLYGFRSAQFIGRALHYAAGNRYNAAYSFICSHITLIHYPTRSQVGYSFTLPN